MERFSSDESENEDVVESEQTLATINLKKPIQPTLPKLFLDKAKEVQRLIVQRI